MESVGIETAHNVEIRLEAAGLGDRVLAALIDYLILLSYYYLTIGLIVGLGVARLSVLVAAYLPVLLYFVLFEIFGDGQSIGKKLRHVKVARLDGRQPTVGNYLLRWLFHLFEVDLCVGTIAMITVLVNGKGQRLGDVAAGTTVVKVRRRTTLRETLFDEVDEHHVVTYPQVENLNPHDVETAKEVLQALIDEGASRPAYLLGRKTKAALEARLGVTSDLTPLQFIRTVIADYNYVHGRA